MLKPNACTYNTKYSHGEKIVVVLGVVVGEVLSLTHYPTKRELEHADTSDLAAKNILLLLKLSNLMSQLVWII